MIACMIERLKQRVDFLNAAKGRRWVTPNFTLQAKQRAEPVKNKLICGDADVKTFQPFCPRIGYTVTKKAGNSVQRNRIRRRLKSAIYNITSQLTEHSLVQPDFDYVLIGRDIILRIDFTILTNELISAFEGVHRVRSSAKATRNAEY